MRAYEASVSHMHVASRSLSICYVLSTLCVASAARLAHAQESPSAATTPNPAGEQPAPTVPAPTIPAPAEELAPACVPDCRAGFVCASGQCVGACNPPCGAGHRCTATRECVLDAVSSTSAAPPPAWTRTGP